MAEQIVTNEQGEAGFTGETDEKAGREQAEEIVNVLRSYWHEADNARRSGLNPRDGKWKQNLDLYWNRVDFGEKASWQAQETMPEVPGFVDRFAAAMKEALVASPDGFYTIKDPADNEQDLTPALKRITDVWLSRAGRNQNGTLLPFGTVFEEQCKLGALMATSSVVTWKKDTPHGRVAVETVDPRFVWLDHTYRNLYRIRRIEVDRHELARMARAKDSNGNPLFNIDEVDGLVGTLSLEDQAWREQLSGHGQDVITPRKPIVLDEYIATVVDSNNEIIADRALMIVANEQWLIRGPEKNPFWHGKDWLVFAPLITTPLSVYGRTYMEDFGDLSLTFTHLTNLILDAVFASTLKGYVMAPEMLLNPQQAKSGLKPGKIWMVEDGVPLDQFAKELDLGMLPRESVEVWQALKNELTEAAGINEVGLGQFAPKGRTSATEVMEAQQNSAALVRSVAQTLEMRYLEPTLDLVWKTGLQHADPEDPVLRAAAEPELYDALLMHRRELIKRPVTFQARGISMVIQRGQKLQNLLQLLQVIAQSENLVAAFLEKVDLQKLVEELFRLSNIDLHKLMPTERQQIIRDIASPLWARKQELGPPQQTPGAQQVGQAVEGMGLGR